MSSLQAGMLVHHAQDDRSGVDVQQVVGRADSGFDPARLAAAFEHATRRRDALRSIFRIDGLAEPALTVVNVPAEVRHRDWSSVSPSEIEAQFRAWRHRDRHEPFDVAKRPPSRLTVFELGQGRGFFCWTFHHLLIDGRSIPLVLDDLMRGYLGDDLGAPAPSIVEHLRAAASDPAGRDLDALRTWIADVEEPTPIEMGMPLRAPALAQDPRSISVEAGSDAVRRFGDGARRLGVTPGTLIHAAWALLLSRYADRSKVLLGSTRAGRAHFGPEVSDLAGMLINTVPLHVDCRGDQTVGAWLRDLRTQQVAQRDFERVDLASAGNLTGIPPGTSLFESLVVFDGATVDQRMKERGLPLEDWCFDYFGQTNYPLTLAAYLKPNLLLRLEYDPSRVDGSTARQLLEHFRGLLNRIIEATPETQLGDISLLSEAERDWLVHGLNETERAVPALGELQHPFQRRAAQRPEAVALRCQGASMTYGALQDRATDIAAALLEAGLGPGEPVSVCLPRGFDLVASLIGVLQAGGVYVPVDPAYPYERRRFLIEDSQARFVVTESTMSDGSDEPLPSDVHILRVDRDIVSSSETKRPRPPRRADEPAYIIYTSGSTGRPKGVRVSHGAALNLIDWVNRTFKVGAEDHLLFVTSPCFDLSVYDIFGMLGAGGQITIATERELSEPDTLVRYLREGGISFWDSAPGALDRLAPLFRSAPQSKLRVVFLSGDWIPVRLPDEVRSFFPGAEVIALGGATEATIWSNYYRVGDVDPRWPSIPYGRPIQNARYLVLDSHLEPAPVGAPGDLYIGGPCLALGYHRRPELTRERFIPDPFREGERLYRTGDRARMMPCGNLEFLGRQDGQVKIRGFRVELGEITATLDTHSLVENAVVTVAGTDATKRLVAFVAARPGATAVPKKLESFLTRQLPAHMVPSQIVEVPEIPLTDNGKVDYRALVDGLEDGEASDPELEDDEEVHVALVWERLLGRPPGRRDDFFRCGGNSVLAVRLVAELERTLGVKVPLPEVFRKPSVEGIAAACRTSSARAPRAAVLPLSEHGRGPPIYLLLGVFHYYGLARLLSPQLSPHGVVVPSEQRLIADPSAEMSVEELAREYAETIAQHHPGGPVYLGGLSFGGMLAFETARQLQRVGFEIGHVILLDSILPRYYRRGRLKSAISRLIPPRSTSVRQALVNLGEGWKVEPGERRAYRVAADRFELSISTHAGPATLIRAADSFVAPDAPRDLGWRQRFQDPLRVEVVTGGHLSMLQAPNVEAVAEIISHACLAVDADRTAL